MADVEPGEQQELTERNRRAHELFKLVVVGSPRDRPPILLGLNAELRPYKLALVAMGGRKYD